MPTIQRSAADVDSEIADWLTNTRVVVTAQAPVLTLMAGETTGEAALWLTPYGQGRIIVSALPEVFSNHALAGAASRKTPRRRSAKQDTISMPAEKNLGTRLAASHRMMGRNGRAMKTAKDARAA